jgi:hypothetical protein
VTSQLDPDLATLRRAQLDDPATVEALRQIAVHRETAAALERRARRATSPAEGALLSRRATHRRLLADRLWQHLVRDAAAMRHPSAYP